MKAEISEDVWKFLWNVGEILGKIIYLKKK